MLKEIKTLSFLVQISEYWEQIHIEGITHISKSQYLNTDLPEIIKIYLTLLFT